MKEIFILRHGETNQNLNGIVQGSGIDSSLNDTGLQQAKKFYLQYKDIPFDLIITSNLIRTQQTVHSFIYGETSFEIDPRIREISWGEHEGKAGEPELMQKYYRIINAWKTGNLEEKPVNGESAMDLQIRLLSFLDDLEKRDFKRVLICSHGRTLRAFICLLKKWSLMRMEEIGHSNTGLYVGNYDGINWNVHRENDIQHLSN